MSFGNAMRGFAKKAAAFRAEAFGGDWRDGTADQQGNNLQLGDRKFRAAFASLRTQRDIEDQGFRYKCNAVAIIPDALALTLNIGDSITYLPDGTTYHIVQTVRHPAAAETKVALRLLQ